MYNPKEGTMCITLRGETNAQSATERWCVRIMLWSVAFGLLAFFASSFVESPAFKVVEGVAAVVFLIALGAYHLYNRVRNRAV